MAPMREAVASTTRTRRPRVFVVEDSRLVRERLIGLLAGVAQPAGVADNAEDAITGILAARPDAVVLDLRLAHGSGFDVLRALRAKAPGIAVYLLTNDTAPQLRRLAGALGARGFFDKTHEFHRVRDVLAAHPSLPAAAGTPPDTLH